MSDFIYEQGFQYTENKFTNQFIDFGNRCELLIEQGLHAFINTNTIYFKQIEHITLSKAVEMYIPKGAKYFLGKDGDIVTNKLIWY